MTRVRATFYDEDDACAVATRLTGEGFQSLVEQERFAGEDDDEDHPWAVVTDAPQVVLDLLVEEYDGWLDVTADEPGPLSPGPPIPPRPLDLPDAPRRIKGYFPRD